MCLGSPAFPWIPAHVLGLLAPGFTIINKGVIPLGTGGDTGPGPGGKDEPCRHVGQELGAEEKTLGQRGTRTQGLSGDLGENPAGGADS